MGWSEVSIMSARREFVRLVKQSGANVRELCRRYGISPTTGYKWIERGEDVEETYEDRSRRPQRSPHQTKEAMVAKILEVRDKHPVWNARKIRRVLERGNETDVPAASTIGAILKRHGRITQAASEAAHKWQRFERPEPNELSQIDFKGFFETGQGRCYPLTMLDDHSRFSQILKACTNEQTETVKTHLIECFRRYGMPRQINADNGNPWGNANGDGHTALTVWLMRRGVRVTHSRPGHPQTNGKDERFHRTLKAELLGSRWFTTIADVQRELDRWRDIYNLERPHDSLELEVPASRYQVSTRPYPEVVPPIVYDSTDLVRKVMSRGGIRFGGREYYISRPSSVSRWRCGRRPKMGSGTFSSAMSGSQRLTAVSPCSAYRHQGTGLWKLTSCGKLLRTFPQDLENVGKKPPTFPTSPTAPTSDHKKEMKPRRNDRNPDGCPSLVARTKE
jgi:transposase InsO family protein